MCFGFLFDSFFSWVIPSGSTTFQENTWSDFFTWNALITDTKLSHPIFLLYWSIIFPSLPHINIKYPYNPQMTNILPGYIIFCNIENILLFWIWCRIRPLVKLKWWLQLNSRWDPIDFLMIFIIISCGNKYIFLFKKQKIILFVLFIFDTNLILFSQISSK